MILEGFELRLRWLQGGVGNLTQRGLATAWLQDEAPPSSAFLTLPPAALGEALRGAAARFSVARVAWRWEGRSRWAEPSPRGASAGGSPEPVPHQVLPVHGLRETLRDQIFQALFLYSVPSKVELEHYMLVLKEAGTGALYGPKQQADMLLRHQGGILTGTA